MKKIKKKLLSIIIACFITCLLFSIPVLAASSSLSKSIRLSTTGKTYFSSGSYIGENVVVTQVKVYLNVASGTDPFDFYIESPSGTVVTFQPSTKSGTYNINSFNGENPKGTWCAWIERRDETSNPNQMNPITITATIGVSVEYN